MIENLICNRWFITFISALAVGISLWLLGEFLEEDGICRSDAEQRDFVKRRRLRPVLSFASAFVVFMLMAGILEVPIA